MQVARSCTELGSPPIGQEVLIFEPQSGGGDPFWRLPLETNLVAHLVSGAYRRSLALKAWKEVISNWQYLRVITAPATLLTYISEAHSNQRVFTKKT